MVGSGIGCGPRGPDKCPNADCLVRRCSSSCPRQAKTSPARKTVEHSRSFRQLVKWRTGLEGRISYLKRGYGWDRTWLDGRHGAATWCGHGVFARNLIRIGALAS
jgi:IS5 family transposase